MIQTVIVIIIVALAAFYIGRGYYLKIQQARNINNRCSCSCDGCDAISNGSDDFENTSKQCPPENRSSA